MQLSVPKTLDDSRTPMKLSLTFDNGPDIDLTPRVLDTLAEFEVKATFFVLGKNLANPALRNLAERAFSEGHRIGNHSYSHAVPFGLLEKPQDGVDELLATDELIGDLRGSEALYRPFGRAQIGRHLLNLPTWDALVARKYTCVLWTFVAPERLMRETWMQPTYEACQEKPWSVVVLHDIPGGATHRLREFLTILKSHEVEFSQDFPVDCTPLRKGVPFGAVDLLMPAIESAPTL